MNGNIISINGGSSSIKFACYNKAEILNIIFSGSVSRIGSSDVEFAAKSISGEWNFRKSVKAGNMSEAVDVIMKWFGEKNNFENIIAIGHRVVHGLNHIEAERISKSLVDELLQNKSYDPDHLPAEIELIKACTDKYPDLPQIACFDTAFHTTMPRVAKLLPIPRRFDKSGMHRFGFHGISYSYLMEMLEKERQSANTGRVVLAHLGNGASMVAVKDGQSIDTSMGLTPAGGFLMGTRSGDIDPGAAYQIMKKEALNADQFNDLINRQSGLIGISETSSDMQTLLNIEESDYRAAEAVSVFCYQVKKWLGAFAAALGGLDTLVFSGGIGENATSVRSRICEGLQFLGIELDHRLNNTSQKIISGKNSKVVVFVIPTDEELMIAKMVCRVLLI